MTWWQSPKGVTALHRASGWAGELLNPTEKMPCSWSPKEGSQASMAALKTSYSCTTASHKTHDKAPVTVLCSISVCPSLGLCTIHQSLAMSPWGKNHPTLLGNTEECPSKLVNHCQLHTSALQIQGNVFRYPKAGGFQSCFQNVCLRLGSQSHFLPVSPQHTFGLDSSPPAHFWA